MKNVCMYKTMETPHEKDFNFHLTELQLQIQLQRWLILGRMPISNTKEFCQHFDRYLNTTKDLKNDDRTESAGLWPAASFKSWNL